MYKFCFGTSLVILLTCSFANSSAFSQVITSTITTKLDENKNTREAETAKRNNGIEANGLRFEVLNLEEDRNWLSLHEPALWVPIKIRITNISQKSIRFNGLADSIKIVGEDDKPLELQQQWTSFGIPGEDFALLKPGERFIRTIDTRFFWRQRSIFVQVRDFIFFKEYQVIQPGKYSIRFKFVSTQEKVNLENKMQPVASEEAWTGEVAFPSIDFFTVNP